MFCSIVPPYLLREIVRRTDDHRAERAAATLRTDVTVPEHQLPGEVKDLVSRRLA